VFLIYSAITNIVQTSITLYNIALPSVTPLIVNIRGVALDMMAAASLRT
jgi:hypothetical protein